MLAPDALALDKPKRRYPEASLQIQIVHHLKLRHRPDVFWFHVPNGLNGSPRRTALLRKMGLLPGMADLVVIIQGRAHFLELKAGRNRPSQEQQAFAGLAEASGSPWAWADSLDAALGILAAWGALRGG